MKKILSFILALCMLVSIMPTFAQDPGITIKYDLSAAMKLEGMKTLSKDKALSVIDYEDTNGLLDVVSYGIGSEIPDNNWFYYNKSTTADSDYNVVMRANKVLAMEIYVPEDGTYQMVAHRGYNNSDNGVVEVYIAEGSFSDTYKWNVGTKFGQYECYGSNHGFAKLADITVHGIGSEEPATIELKAGKYVVAFERVGMEGYYGSVGGFSLVSGDGSGSVPINLASLAINDKTASIQAVMSDGSTKTASDIDVTYTSSNPGVATVDSKTGKITDVASGETTITATATLLGREVSVSATYNSEAEQAPTNNLTIKYDLSAAMKLEGMTALSTAKAPSEIDYEDTNGLLDVVVYGAGNGVPDNNFRYYQKSTSADSDYNIVLRQNQVLAMEIYVPVSGTYKMIAHRGIAKPDLAGDVEVYIYKGEFSDAYKWNVGTKFGRYNCAGSDYGFARLGDTTVNEISAADATVTTDTPATIELQAGKYVVAFERVGMTGYYGSVGGFSLVSGDGSEIIPVYLGGFAIENDKASVQNIVMSDGSVSELGDTKVTYTSLNPDIATVDAVTGVITKVATGEATITATATVLGREVVASRVYNSVVESVPNLTLKYDLSAAMKLEGMKTLTKVKAPSVIDYEDTNNTFDVLSYGIGAEVPDNNWFYYNKSTSADSDYNIVMRVNKVFAMEIYVPVSGKYQMVAHRGYDDADNGVVEVYVANGAFSDAYKWNVGTQLGRYECKGSDRGYSTLSDATVHKISSDEPATIELEAGYHVVAFHRVGMEGYYGSIGGFSLVSGNGNGTVPVSVGNLSIKNKKASAQLILSDGTATELEDVEVTYKSSDETIATIDAKSGAITNVGAGEVTITATAEVNGRSTTASAAYTSVPPDPNGITIKYDLNADIQKVADMKGWSVPAIVPYFTPDLLTSEITNGFYEYFNFTYKSFISNSFYFRPGAKGFVTRDDSIASFKINVPKAGIYDLNVKHSANSTGLDVRVYISKDNYSTADADYVGTYSSKDPSFTGTSDFSNVNGAVEKISTITNVEISEPGEYIITFQPQDATVGNAASWTYGAVGSFELVAGDKTVLMKAMSDYDLIPLGLNTEYKLSATGILSDRSEVALTLSDFMGYDDEVVSVSADGVVRGLKKGKTTVTYNAEYNGTVKQLSTVIEVGGKGISIKYNFGGDIVKLYGTEYATLLKLEDFTYESSGGFFRYFKGSRPVPVGGRFNAYRNFIGLSDGEYVTYEIFVPQAGTYSMTIEHGMYDQALEVDVFVSDKGTSFAAEDRVGYFDCNRDGENNVYNSSVTTLTGAMFPKAGTYYITFQPTNRQDGNTSWYWGFIGDMTLKSGEEAVLAGIIQAEKPEENELIILGIEESSIEWTDVNVPATTNAYVQIKKVNGGTPVNVAENIRFKSSANKIADVDTDGLVTGHSDGTCQITVSAKVAGTQYSAPLNLSVEDNTGVRAARFGIPSALYLRQKAKAPVVITMNSGNEVTVPAELVSYTYSPEGIITIDDQGVAECVAVGETTITATADFRGNRIEVSGAVTTEEHKGKSEPTYFTYEKRENAMNNIKKYSWARATRDSAVAAADKALLAYETLYNQLPEAGIPTAGHITKTQDPNWNICHYCNVNLSEKYGNYSNVQWQISPALDPWKIQCPACKRLFPSNDFELLYERGRDERGHYDIDRALAANAEAVANG
ncbi:MAG: Ig-like domain-containing protein [Oscillospiraceae bacterium]|nr:Ig-like domain-containing protein [Oscillospiraceae bacterium]